MVASVRLLTFNTQLRSWAMEAGDTGDPFVENTAEKRARVIAKRILASPYDYDIIGLMEVFDENARNILKEKLGAKYSSSVIKCDVDSISLQIAQASTLLSTSAVLMAYAIAGFVNTTFEDSGLMLFSRFPFALDNNGNPIVVYWPYTLSSGEDSYAAKGVLIARVLLDGTFNPCDVIISHTQAAYASDEEHSDDRRGQLLEAAKLIDTVTGAPLPSNRVVFFMGDFNVAGTYHSGGPHRPGIAGGEWTSLFNSPDSYFTKILYDLWVHEQSPGLAFATPGAAPGDIEMPYGDKWDFGLSTIDGKRLDYILGRPGGGDRLTVQHLQIAHELMRSNPAIDGETIAFTSDHYPLRADFARDSAFCRVVSALVAPSDFVDWNHEGTLSAYSRGHCH